MENWLTAIAAVIIAVVIPFVVNLCTNEACDAKTKRVVAIIFSVIGGIATAFISGMPTPDTLLLWMFAVIGGVQTAYTAFKSVGVTNSWLDALEKVGQKQ